MRGSLRGSARAALLGTATALMLSACALGGTAASAWSDGEKRGPWRVVFTGYGTVTGADDHVLLEPRTPDAPERTRAALVVTDEQHGDGVELSVTVTTERQLRQDRPNPWEVGWVLWHYTAPERFYAVALKPNGWEVSKQDPAYPGNQRFLATGDEPTFPVSGTYRVEVSSSNGASVITVDGRELARVEDTENPYRRGSVGLYSEDARVRFTDVVVNS